MVSFQDMQAARAQSPGGGATPKVGYAQLLQQIMQNAQQARQMPQSAPPQGAPPVPYANPDSQLMQQQPQMPQASPPQGAPPVPYANPNSQLMQQMSQMPQASPPQGGSPMMPQALPHAPQGNTSPDYLRGLELGRMLRASRGR